MKDIESVTILTNYNNTSDTKECVESIQQVNGPKPFIVIVDNHSDDTSDLESLTKEYNNIHLILNNDNLGFGRANNLGIQWANQNVNYQFLLLLNNDTTIEKHCIEELMNGFHQSDNIGIVTGKIHYYYNRDLIWYGGGFINLLRGTPRIDDFNQPPSEQGANKGKEVTFISGCTMMFSKESITVLRGFDEDFFMYSEDVELCMRASYYGLKMYYQPSAVIYHKVQGSTNKGENEGRLTASNPNLRFLFVHMKTNQYLAMIKHLTGTQLFMFKLIYWIEFIYACLKLLFNGRFDIFSIGLKTIGSINRIKRKRSSNLR